MRLLKDFAKKIREYFSDKGYSCDVCGRELFDYPSQRLCDDCREQLFVNDEKPCPRCGRRTVSGGVCMNCKRDLPKFHLGISPFVYMGKTAEVANLVKNGNRKLVYFFAAEMAKRLQDTLSNEELSTPLLLCGVPLFATREAERGYNQANELAEQVCVELKKAGILAEYVDDVLTKTKETAAQKRRSYKERKENVAGAFHVHRRALCKDRTVVLVDDIMTTGATGNECAARLLGAGAKRVVFLTAASLPELK